MKNGVLISLDALLALTLLFSIILISFFYFNNIFQTPDYTILKKTAIDVSTVLEKNSALENAIRDNDFSDVFAFFDLLPQNTCIKISVFEETDLQNPVLEETRTGCTQDLSNSATLNRSILVSQSLNADFYLARTIVWFKEAE